MFSVTLFFIKSNGIFQKLNDNKYTIMNPIGNINKVGHGEKILFIHIIGFNVLKNKKFIGI